MRKAVSKGTRFEVFKRDHFTCQYCGGQPPQAVLVIDHIEPVSTGGDNDMVNLMTACESCNQGKTNRSLTHIPIRPDADLLYLETQQEIAELRRYQAKSEERDRLLDITVKALQATWLRYFPPNQSWVPAGHVIHSMLRKYSPEIVEEALIVTALRVTAGHVTEQTGGWYRYAWGVMRTIEETHAHALST